MEQNNDKIHEARFLSLVMSLHGSAWIALGKVANPMTGKAEKDLEAARAHINLLETLKVKTRGNLTLEEERLLAHYLSTLQLNYVEEAAREKQTAAEKPAPAPDAGPGEGKSDAPPQP